MAPGQWCMDTAADTVTCRVTLRPQNRVYVPQRGVWAHQLHAGAEGAISVNRHRMLIIPGRSSRVRHQLPVNRLPKVHCFPRNLGVLSCITSELGCQPHDMTQLSAELTTW